MAWRTLVSSFDISEGGFSGSGSVTGFRFLGPTGGKFVVVPLSRGVKRTADDDEHLPLGVRVFKGRPGSSLIAGGLGRTAFGGFESGAGGVRGFCWGVAKGCFVESESGGNTSAGG